VNPELEQYLLELAYVALGMFFGIITFTVTVTGLALSIGLLPAFLLGVPVLVGTVYVVHGMAIMERRRAMLLMDVDLPARPMPRKPGQNWLRRSLALTVSPEFWKEASYSLLLLPLGVISGTLVVSFWAVASRTTAMYPLVPSLSCQPEAVTRQSIGFASFRRDCMA